ncbi:MAG: LytR C-terminal domain-containing protein [Longimonas sp.]|uniref:LytR C-terminal domain-containing protein n=1 Tax=Longimonas sp. TaxID=2039626 RepID=UPI00397656DD
MSWTSTRAKDVALNVGLAFLGLMCAALVYGLVAQPGGTPNTNPDRAASSNELVGTVIQVEVRNAAGADGLAATVMTYLRDEGFDVVDVGNHDAFDVEHTQVIDRIGDAESARRVAQALGVEEEHIHQDIQPDLYLDASVLIGHDYARLTPFQETE